MKLPVFINITMNW